ncbi:MAG: hypothetical protein KAW42_06475 [Candidatus Atribacteria bacterium]|nr:hypothetical protein [Candidatus Atribacteria bacterium]MCK4309602.1 hypothetical protein [Candidatus Atribacteria bacterium]
MSMIILLPNLLVLFFPPLKIPENMSETHILVTILERVGQIGCFVLPILLGKTLSKLNINYFAIGMVVCVLIYYGCWVRFFFCGRDFYLLFKPLGIILIPMAIAPLLYFCFLTLWTKSYLLGVSTIVFAVGHLINSYNTYSTIFK